MAKIHRTTDTGAAAIASSLTAVGRSGITVLSVAVHFSTAPTTSENLTATIDTASGATYDTVARSVDPGDIGSVTDVFWEGPIPLFEGDALDVAYTNTDARTIGVTYLWREGAE